MTDPLSSSQTDSTIPQTALEKLLAFYRYELQKKYNAAKKSLQAYKKSLVQAGQDNSAMQELLDELKRWYDDLDKQIKDFEKQSQDYANSFQKRQDELQRIVNQYETLSEKYPYLTAQDISTLPQPLQDIASHRTQLEQVETRLGNIDTEFATLNQTVAMLNAQIQALKSASDEKIRHARALLRGKLDHLIGYYQVLASVPEKTTDEKYHDVYNYLRVAIETCPAEAFDSELVSVIQHTIGIILRCIETAIEQKKKGIFGKNDHWLEYHYKHPARAISTLGLVAQEKSNQFNPPQPSQFNPSQSSQFNPSQSI